MAEKTRDRAEMFGLDENARHRGVIEALVIAKPLPFRYILVVFV